MFSPINSTCCSLLGQQQFLFRNWLINLWVAVLIDLNHLNHWSKIFFCLFVLRWITGLGLLSKLSGYSTFGWAFTLCYRVRISVSLSLSKEYDFLFWKGIWIIKLLMCWFSLWFRQLAFFTGPTGSISILMSYNVILSICPNHLVLLIVCWLHH